MYMSKILETPNRHLRLLVCGGRPVVGVWQISGCLYPVGVFCNDARKGRPCARPVRYKPTPSVVLWSICQVF